MSSETGANGSLLVHCNHVYRPGLLGSDVGKIESGVQGHIVPE